MTKRKAPCPEFGHAADDIDATLAYVRDYRPGMSIAGIVEELAAEIVVLRARLAADAGVSR